MPRSARESSAEWRKAGLEQMGMKRNLYRPRGFSTSEIAEARWSIRGAVVGMVVTTVPYLERAKDRNGASIGNVSMKSGIGYSIPAPVIRRWLSVQHLDSSLPSAPPTWTKVVSHGTDPEADRSFATGHLLHTIALVLHPGFRSAPPSVSTYGTAARLKPEAPWIARNLGLAYADSGQWSHALQAYLRGLNSRHTMRNC